MDQKSYKRKGNRNLKKESNLLREYVTNTAASSDDIFEFCFDHAWHHQSNGFQFSPPGNDVTKVEKERVSPKGSSDSPPSQLKNYLFEILDLPHNPNNANIPVENVVIATRGVITESRKTITVCSAANLQGVKLARNRYHCFAIRHSEELFEK